MRAFSRASACRHSGMTLGSSSHALGKRSLFYTVEYDTPAPADLEHAPDRRNRKRHRLYCRVDRRLAECRGFSRRGATKLHDARAPLEYLGHVSDASNRPMLSLIVQPHRLAPVVRNASKPQSSTCAPLESYCEATWTSEAGSVSEEGKKLRPIDMKAELIRRRQGRSNIFPSAAERAHLYDSLHRSNPVPKSTH